MITEFVDLIRARVKVFTKDRAHLSGEEAMFIFDMAIVTSLAILAKKEIERTQAEVRHGFN